MRFRSRKRIALSGLIFTLSFLFAGILQVIAAGKLSEENPVISGPVSMKVEYGYGDVAKGGRYVPVKIEAENHEKQPFEGIIAISTMESDYGVYFYNYPLKIEGDGKTEQSCMVPFGQGSEQVFVSIKDKNGNLVVKKRLKMDINRETPELFVGVLSDSMEKLNYLDGAGISYSALKSRMIPLGKESVPEEAIGLNLMDVVLVSSYRLRDLSEKQTKAIMDWVKDGGILVLGTGERVDDTLGRFAPELLDDNYDMPVAMDVHMESVGDGQQEPISGLMCVDIPLHGANVLESESGFPLFQAAAMEKGIIAVAAYDFADISDFAAQEPSYVDNMFTGLLGKERIQNLTDYYYGGSSEDYWAVQRVINSGNVNRLPNVKIYVLVIVLYILLAGPVVYYFLRKWEMRHYYWGVVTALSLVFVGVIYLMGMKTRFKSTFLTYATIHDISEDTIIEISYVNVRNPYNKPYSLELSPEYSVRPINRRASYGTNSSVRFTDLVQPRASVWYNEMSARLNFHEAAAFESNYLQLRKIQENKGKGGIVGEISYFDGEVKGEITNQYDFVLEDSAVLLYGELILLGDMQPGETRNLEELSVCHAPVGEEAFVAARITGLDSYERADINDKTYVQDMERSNLLAFYMRRELEGYRREARVIGFSNQQDPQFTGDKGIEVYGLNMFTSAIAVYNDTAEGEIYRSALMKAPKAQTGSYDYIKNAMYGMDSVTLEYSLGNDIQVDEITFCQVAEELLGNELLGRVYRFNGDMYFYNFNSGSYDKMDRNKEKFSIDELSSYLSPGNTMTIKYIDSRQEDSGWDTVLPMPMVKGREK
ncbi:hypothetical protein AALB16_11845 [Lachnospiraceae bacterium 62-35]